MNKLIKNIEQDKDLLKSISKINYYELEMFISDAKRWIKAIEARRVICSIGSVSNSGMSRTMKFLAPEKGPQGYNYYNYFAFFKSMGFTPVKESDYFRIGGCGMNMVFHCNYTIIHKLHRLGFINKDKCHKLCQMTPTVI